MTDNGEARLGAPGGESRSGTPDGAPGFRAGAAERKLVTVLFADIVDSSSLVSGRDPEDADQALLGILEVMADAVRRYDGIVAQMLGDGLLAVFGAPAAQEHHALRSCLAAQDMVQFARAESNGHRVRIGIATGEVVAHVVENGVWTDYRTVGECVHLAAKLQQRAEPNSVLLSRETAELTPAGLTVRPAGMFAFGGPDRLLPVFEMLGVRARRRTATDLTSPNAGRFVGRRREQEALRAALASARDGVGTTILLRGEAGIGKSRLVGELLRDCPLALLQWPQAPIRRLGDPDELELAAATLADLAGGAEEAARAAERGGGALSGAGVRELLGLPVTEPLWRGLQPAERQPHAMEGLVAATIELARTRPLVVLVEDAHWATPIMARLLDALAAALESEAAGAWALLLATARPERAGWTGGPGALCLDLEPLASDQTQDFLDDRLGRHPSLAGVKARVAAKSQGVPLYLEESLRALETAGAIVGDPGDYRPGHAAATYDLPASVHALLASRIDALGAEARRTLLTAAVIGPAFDVGLLRDLAPVPSHTLADRLADLEEAGLVRRMRLLPNLEYGFRHALIQEVAYGTLLRAERRVQHTRIVEALRRRRDHNLPGRIDLLAHHAFHAEDWAYAYAYGRRAGGRAEARSRLVDASQHYQNALAALDRLEPSLRNTLRRIDLSLALPRSLLPRGVTGVDDHLTRARDLALRVGDPLRFARAASLHAAFEWSHGDIERAIQLCHDGLEAIGDKGGLETRVPLLVRFGGVLAEKGVFPEGCSAVKEARRLLSFVGPFDQCGLAAVGVVAASSQMARCLAEMGLAEDAMRACQEAVEVAEDSRHAFSRLYACEHMGWTALLLGNVEAGLPSLEAAFSLAEMTRSYLHQPFVMGALGYAYVMSGNRTRGLDLLERSVAIYGAGGPKLWAQQVAIWNAEALMLAGLAEQAFSEAKRAYDLAGIEGRMGYRARAAVVLAEAAIAARRDDANTGHILREGRQLAHRLSMRQLADQCERTAARIGERLPSH